MAVNQNLYEDLVTSQLRVWAPESEFTDLELRSLSSGLGSYVSIPNSGLSIAAFEIGSGQNKADVYFMGNRYELRMFEEYFKIAANSPENSVAYQMVYGQYASDFAATTQGNILVGLHNNPDSESIGIGKEISSVAGSSYALSDEYVAGLEQPHITNIVTIDRVYFDRLARAKAYHKELRNSGNRTELRRTRTAVATLEMAILGAINHEFLHALNDQPHDWGDYSLEAIKNDWTTQKNVQYLVETGMLKTPESVEEYYLKKQEAVEDGRENRIGSSLSSSTGQDEDSQEDGAVSASVKDARYEEAVTLRINQLIEMSLEAAAETGDVDAQEALELFRNNPVQLKFDRSITADADNTLLSITEGGQTIYFDRDGNIHRREVEMEQGGVQIFDYPNGDDGATVTILQTPGAFGLTDTEVFLGDPRDPDSTAISVSQIGSIFGSNIGGALAGPDASHFERIAATSLLGAVGELLAETATVAFTDFSLTKAFDEAAQGFGADVVGNVKGALVSMAMGELVEAIGFSDSFAGQVAQTTFTTLLSQAGNVSKTITAVKAGEKLSDISALKDVGNALGGALGGMVGTYLGAKVYQPKTVEGQIGASTGAAIGSYYGAVIGSVIPVVGTFIGAAIGAFIGYIVGGVFGDLIGGTPRAWADVLYDSVSGDLYVANTRSKDNGDVEAVRGLAQSIADGVNDLVDTIGGRIIGWVGAVTVGAHEDKYFVAGNGLTGQKMEDANSVVQLGLFNYLSMLKIEGGDTMMKRALKATMPLIYQRDIVPAPNAPSILFGNFAVARDFGFYLQNADTINAIIKAEPYSAFTAGWVITIQQAIDIGLNKRYVSDTYGGWNLTLTEDLSRNASESDIAGILENQAALAINAEVMLDERGRRVVDLYHVQQGAYVHTRRVNDTIINKSTYDLAELNEALGRIAEFEAANNVSVLTVGAEQSAVQVLLERFYAGDTIITDLDLLGDIYDEALDVAAQNSSDVSDEFANLLSRVSDGEWVERINTNDSAPTYIRLRDNEGGYVEGVESAAVIFGRDEGEGSIDAPLQLGDLGNDFIGGDGQDFVEGGRNADWMFGGGGDDYLSVADTASNSNYLNGGDDNDALLGGRGSDWLVGGSGSDSLFGNAGDDILDGGGLAEGAGQTDEDYAVGGGGNDTYLFNANGGDLFIIDEGVNVTNVDYNSLTGEWVWEDNQRGGRLRGGKDTLQLGYVEHNGDREWIGLDNIIIESVNWDDSTNQVQSTGVKNDLLISIRHSSLSSSDPATDRVVIKSWNLDAFQRIENLMFADGFSIAIGDFKSFIVGTAFDDVLEGTDGADFILALEGDDILTGLGGEDLLIGGGDDDTIQGDAQSDVAYGSEGVDTLYGEQGDDLLVGGPGSDSLYGELGNDVINGGLGDDLAVLGFGDDRYIFKRGDGRDTLIDTYPGTVTFVAEHQYGVNLPLHHYDGGNINRWYFYADGWDIERVSEELPLGQLELVSRTGQHPTLWNSLHGTIDRYYFYESSGSVSPEDNGEDTIEFGIGVSPVDLQFRRDGDDLQVGITNPSLQGELFTELNDVVTISDWYRDSDESDDIYTNLAPIEFFEFFTYSNLAGADNYFADWIIIGGDETAHALLEDNDDATLPEASDYDDTFVIGSTDSRNHWITGGLGNDVLEGGSARDILNGGAGNDYLYDSVGASGITDSLMGGIGNDTFFVRGIGVVEIVGGEGVDTIDFSEAVEEGFIDRSIINGLDFIYPGGYVPGMVADISSGVWRSNITINRGAPFIYVMFQAVYDYYAIYNEVSAGDIVTINHILQSSEQSISGSITDIENLVGSIFVDTLYGDELQNILSGGGNIIIGGNADLLVGRDGDDIYEYSLGDGRVDIQDQENVADASYDPGESGEDAVLFGADIAMSDITIHRPVDSLDLHITVGDPANNDILVLRNWYGGSLHRIEYLEFSNGAVIDIRRSVFDENGGVATSGDDILRLQASDYSSSFSFGFQYGGQGEDILLGSDMTEVMFGGLGDDTFDGGLGFDIFVGGQGIDTVSYYGRDVGVLVNMDPDSFSAPDGDNFSSIENLLLTDLGDTVYGDSNDNMLSGLQGVDELWGYAGEDSLVGGAGADILHGGDGEDVLEGGTGEDTLFGGDGADYLAGGAGADSLEGGAGYDRLFGGDGGDELFGQQGEDLLSGGAGNDRLHGLEDNDSLSGDAGDDELYGGTGDDLLIGGEGNDQLYGGDGSDAYIFNRDSGRDNVYEIGAGGGVNRIVFEGDIEFGNLWFEYNAIDDAVTIHVLNSNTSVTIADYSWFVGQSDSFTIETADHILDTMLDIGLVVLSYSNFTQGGVPADIYNVLDAIDPSSGEANGLLNDYITAHWQDKSALIGDAEEPVFTVDRIGDFAIADNVDQGSLIGQFVVQDGAQAVSGTVTFSLVNTSGGRFSIDAQTGVLRTNKDNTDRRYFDGAAQSVLPVIVRAIDEAGNRYEFEQQIAIADRDVRLNDLRVQIDEHNASPERDNTEYNPNSGLAAGDVVGAVTMSKADDVVIDRFEIVGGNLGDAFTIDAEGVIRTNSSNVQYVNFEDRDAFDLRVRAVTDEGVISNTVDVRIDINDIVEQSLALSIIDIYSSSNYLSPDPWARSEFLAADAAAGYELSLGVDHSNVPKNTSVSRAYYDIMYEGVRVPGAYFELLLNVYDDTVIQQAAIVSEASDNRPFSFASNVELSGPYFPYFPLNTEYEYPNFDNLSLYFNSLNSYELAPPVINSSGGYNSAAQPHPWVSPWYNAENPQGYYNKGSFYSDGAVNAGNVGQPYNFSVLRNWGVYSDSFDADQNPVVLDFDVAPTANSDNFFIDQDTALRLDAEELLLNDFDTDALHGDTLSIRNVNDEDLGVTTTTMFGGTLQYDSLTREIYYMPLAGFSGVDSFNYEIEDATGNTAIATVTIDVGSSDLGDNVIIGDSDQALTVVYGTNGSDHLWGGGSASAILLGGAGDDTYYHFAADIGTVIFPSPGEEVLRLGQGIVAEDITFTVSGVDLLLDIAGTGSINLFRFLSGDEHIDRVEFASGQVWSAFDLNRLAFTGTNQSDQITGSVIDDVLTGLDGADQLNGAEGDDVLIGGLGDDNLSGGAGNDAYQFSTGFGQDEINEVLASDSSDGIVFYSEIRREELSFVRQGDDLLIQHDADQITVTDAFLDVANQDSRIEWVEVEGQRYELLLSGMDLSTHYTGNVLYVGDSVAGGSPHSPAAIQSDGTQWLVGGAGADTLSGALNGGLYVGGPGNDYLLGGDGASLSLLGGAGNDGLRSHADSADYLQGGVGDDSYYMYQLYQASADRVDVVNNVDSADTDTDALYLVGSSDSFWFSEDGADLLIDYVYETAADTNHEKQIVVTDWFALESARFENMQTVLDAGSLGADSAEIYTRVNQLVSALAAISPDAPGDLANLTPEQQTQYNNAVAAAWGTTVV